MKKIVIALTFLSLLLLPNTFAAETTENAVEKITSTWTMTDILPKEIPTLHKGNYRPLAELRTSNSEYPVRFFLIEIDPHSVEEANKLGIHVQDSDSQGNYVHRNGPARLAINIWPAFSSITKELNSFLENHFKKEMDEFFGPILSPSCYDKNYETSFSCITFPFKNYHHVDVIFKKIGELSHFSEADQQFFSVVYTTLEDLYLTMQS